MQSSERDSKLARAGRQIDAIARPLILLENLHGDTKSDDVDRRDVLRPRILLGRPHGDAKGDDVDRRDVPRPLSVEVLMFFDRLMLPFDAPQPLDPRPTQRRRRALPLNDDADDSLS